MKVKISTNWGWLKRKKSVRFVSLTLLSLMLVSLFSIGFHIAQPAFKTRTFFKVEPSPLNHTYDLFDLGIVDANSDSNLDIFTLNHSAKQDLILGNGDGTVTENVLSSWGFDQDPQYAGIEDSDKAPDMSSTPGLYIYRQNFALHLRSYEVTDSISGQLKLMLPVKLQKQEQARVEISKSQQADGAVATIVTFEVAPEGWVILEGFPEIPHEFQIDSNIPLENIWLGMQGEHPKDREFSLLWRDWHTMAWTDLNQDKQLDVFIGRGGILGHLKDFPISLQDELYVSNTKNSAGESFVDEWTELGFLKGNCPVRQSSWVDFNGDNLIDLYIVCGRILDDPRRYPNRLYEQQADGQFVDIAAQVGLDLPYEGHAFWLDADQDNDFDLLTSQGDRVQLYINRQNQFHQVFDEQFEKEITKLAVADLDQDSDLDAYVVIKGGQNGLLRNQNGNYRYEEPETLGLPSEGLDANWVDYDNDGLLDLHVVPSGLYQQTPQGKFKTTQLIDLQFPGFNTWNSRSAWFDIDNDGDRDLLLAYQQRPGLLQPTPSFQERIVNQLQKRDTSRIWQSKLYHNESPNKNHWISLKLIGDAGNPQAIGAKVWVSAGGQTQFQQVGGSENSRYSQGHYRLYFGLGRSKAIDMIRIVWPDGSQQQLSPDKLERAIDQLVVIPKKST